METINIIKSELKKIENLQDITSRNIKTTVENILLILKQNSDGVDVLEEALELYSLIVENYYLRRTKRVLADAVRKLEAQNAR